MKQMTRGDAPTNAGMCRPRRRGLVVALLAGAMAVLVVACTASRTPTASRTEPAGPAEPAESVVSTAQAMLGRPYEYGGETPAGFDCSGLVAYAHERAGIEVPRTVARQLEAVQRLPRSALEPGDLVFFELDDKPAHVGIYVGNNDFIHAPSSGGHVHRSDMDRDYWRRRFLAAGRF